MHIGTYSQVLLYFFILFSLDLVEFYSSSRQQILDLTSLLTTRYIRFIATEQNRQGKMERFKETEQNDAPRKVQVMYTEAEQENLQIM